jgi:hypothetical protein
MSYSFIQSCLCASVLFCPRSPVPITVAARSKAWTFVSLLHTGIMGSNPTRGIGVYLRLFCVCVVLCVGSGLKTDLSSVQCVLPTMYRLRNWKAAKVHKGYRAIDSVSNSSIIYLFIIWFSGLLDLFLHDMNIEANDKCRIIGYAFLEYFHANWCLEYSFLRLFLFKYVYPILQLILFRPFERVDLSWCPGYSYISIHKIKFICLSVSSNAVNSKSF